MPEISASEIASGHQAPTLSSFSWTRTNLSILENNDKRHALEVVEWPERFAISPPPLVGEDFLLIQIHNCVRASRSIRRHRFKSAVKQTDGGREV
jgi:hypothetical protein